MKVENLAHALRVEFNGKFARDDWNELDVAWKECWIDRAQRIMDSLERMDNLDTSNTETSKIGTGKAG